MARPATFVVDAGDSDLNPGKLQTLKFHLERDGKTLYDFDLLHERVMHFIVVRDALDEFQHLHPRVTADGLASIEITFPSAGTYWLYIDCQPSGEAQLTARHEIKIAGQVPVAPDLQPDVPGVIATPVSHATVSLERAGDEWLMTFALADADGKPSSDIEPYLGAMGHLVVIGAGTGEYVHAHAETQSAPDGKVQFAAHFARPGIYKAWGQFQRKGTVFTVPAVLQID